MKETVERELLEILKDVLTSYCISSNYYDLRQECNDKDLHEAILKNASLYTMEFKNKKYSEATLSALAEAIREVVLIRELDTDEIRLITGASCDLLKHIIESEEQ